MKKFKIFISIIILYFMGSVYSFANDCSKFGKLSKEYTKCNAELLKKKAENLKNKTSKKTESLKQKATDKIVDGKKKFNMSKFKKTFTKFKNSKNHKEFMEKIKNDN